MKGFGVKMAEHAHRSFRNIQGSIQESKLLVMTLVNTENDRRQERAV